MVFLLASLALFFAGGVASLAAGNGQNASRIGACSAVAASLLGLIPALTLFGGAAELSFTVAKLPMGEFALRMDLLSAVFLTPVLLITAAAAIFGVGAPAKETGPHAGAHWFFYNLLASAMVVTLTANDAFLFLLAWEVMSLTPFFLISLSDKSETTRSGAWIYLVAAHLGALFLLAFFALLSTGNGGAFSFSALTKTDVFNPTLQNSSLLFILAFIGFGAKNGFFPFHVWLPEAYPSAPNHVAAVMSGAMVNMGIYGLARSFGFIGIGEAWWSHLLIGVGAFSAFFGIIQALGQPSIKRALAFSSVENMGIICMAFGIALLCLQTGHTGAAALAATGGVVHAVNHALSKGLLFLCAGCVSNSAGGGMLRALGGLQKRIPVVGWCFVLGSASIAALPPLNGFAGEFFIYLSMVFGGTAFTHGMNPEYSLFFWACLFMLAGVGGFTLFCFARLYGIAFLGAPRSDAAAQGRPASKNEIGAIIFMAALCVLSAIAAPRVAATCHASLAPILYAPQTAAAPAFGPGSAPLPYIPESFTPPRLEANLESSASAIGVLHNINRVALAFVIAAFAAFLVRRRLLRNRRINASPTWDCGYMAPTARMQYTGGSFSLPATLLMRASVRQEIDQPPITEYFPLKAKAVLTTPDWVIEKGFAPLFILVHRVSSWSKALQHGRANAYILYILITLVVLLGWKLG